MTSQQASQLTDNTKLADMTAGELQALIREEMRKALYEFMGDFAEYVPNPDERWEVKPEVYRKLHAFLKEKREATGKLSAEDKPETSALQKLIRDEMRKVAWELTDEMPDPDEGKELRPEFAEELRQVLDEKGKLLSLEEIKRELGLDDQ